MVDFSHYDDVEYGFRTAVSPQISSDLIGTGWPNKP